MDVRLYEDIVSQIRKCKDLSRNCLLILQNTFPSISPDTLYSILLLEYQKRMKINHVKFSSNVDIFWNLYKDAIQQSEAPGIILRIATKFDTSPCLVGKLILQKYLEETDVAEQSATSSYIRDTTQIPDKNLSHEIFLCGIYDNLYSPTSETMKHSLGQEYEIKLHNQAVKMDLVFRNEDQLRKSGYDKTPDIKLDVPVAIDGFVINWIESKALFGDEDVHRRYTRHQYLSYWNRFGPGLVIYWFGFLETIVESDDKRFIIKNHLPTNIVQVKHFFESHRQKNV